jgi:hypothetical protein
LPFSYYVELHNDPLVLRRADASDVATFGAIDVDFFEVELSVWEDYD